MFLPVGLLLLLMLLLYPFLGFLRGCCPHCPLGWKLIELWSLSRTWSISWLSSGRLLEREQLNMS